MCTTVSRYTSAVVLGFVFAAAAIGQTSFSNTNAISVTNGGTTSSTINVSGLSSPITKVTVTLHNLNAPFINDLDLLLVSPTGAKYKILSDAGGGSPVSNVSITLDDAAANTVPSPMVSGTFKPTDTGAGADNFPPQTGPFPTPPVDTFASVFNGSLPNGTWTLYATDDVLGADSLVTISGGWTITITAQPNIQPTGTTLSSSRNPSFTTAPNNSVTFTATVTSGGNPVTTGTVNFTQGLTTLASNVALNGSGQAQFTTSFATEGSRIVTATYSGTATFGTSSGSITQVTDNHTVISGPQFCNTGVIAVTNGSGLPFPQRVFVSGLNNLTTLTLTLNNINHPFGNDLDILLVSPDGRMFVPVSDAGSGVSASNVTLVLSDAAGASLPSSGSLSSGTFRPTTYGPADVFSAPAPAGPYFEAAPAGGASFTSVFGGANPNGTWSLYVHDDVLGPEQASIGGYCLTFTTTSDAPTTTLVSSSANPSTTGNSVTFTATVVRTSDSANVNGGTVTFREGATILAGPVGVVNGTASFSTNALSEGSHTITADFSGVPGQFNVSSASVTQVVDDATQISGNSFCNLGPLVIPASGLPAQYPLRFQVSGRPGVVGNVSVSLNGLSHGGPDDLDMILVSPSGEKLVFWSDVGGQTPVSGLNITVSDSGTSQLSDAGSLTSGTFRPTAVNNDESFPSPAPQPPYLPANLASPAGIGTFASAFANIVPNGFWSLYVIDDVAGVTGTIADGVCLNFTITPPDLSISKVHSGNLSQGQTGATYTITVSNSGPGSTAGTVTVSDTLPAGLTATAISGTGWTCVLGTLTCTRNDTLAAGQSYPAITLTVNVAANAAASVTNSATVSGGGDASSGNNTANDQTTINQFVTVTVNTSPAGLSFSVDGTSYTSEQTFQFAYGSSHTIATASPQSGGTGTRYVWQSWSDAGAISHSIAPSSSATYTASFVTEHELTTNVTPAGGGTVSPTGGFFTQGTAVQLTATPAACYAFSSWSSNAPAGLVTMSSPQTVTATFTGSVASNVNGQVTTTVSGYRLNRATGRYLQTVTLRNIGAALSNVLLALDGLPSGISLHNPNGTTSCTPPAGSPYRTIGALGAGASVSLTLEFVNPGTGQINYSRRVLAGPGQP